MAELTNIKDLDKFQEKLKAVQKNAPGLIYQRYDKLGNKVRKKLKAVTPKSNLRKSNNKRLESGWTAERTTRENGVYVKKIRNKRPHYHLVERGHKVVRRGNGNNPKGKNFVKGKFFADKKLKAMESDIAKEQEKLIDDLFEELFP